MPIYEYECPKCSAKTERILKFAEMNSVQYCQAPVALAPTDATEQLCSGQLQRVEVSLNADMSHMWQP